MQLSLQCLTEDNPKRYGKVGKLLSSLGRISSNLCWSKGLGTRLYYHDDTPYSVFTSASGEGAQAWTSPSSSQHLDSEEEPITYGSSPISLEDDPEPQV